ncbi:MAG: hypothetical protein ACREFX_08215 [Opitutaceae bacterium]
MSNSLPDRWVARFPQHLEEILWAFGLVSLPKRRTPPPWVKALILRLYGTGEFRSFPEANPATHPDFTPETLGKLVGGGTVFSRLLTAPDVQLMEEERENPELREYREKIMAQLRAMLAAIKDLSIRLLLPGNHLVQSIRAPGVNLSERYRASSEITRLPIWRHSSESRRSASLRSLVFSDRRNCLLPRLTRA